MSVSNNIYLIRTSIDNKEIAKRIAKSLVEEQLAVSVHIREVNSIYQWKGEIVDTEEWEIEGITTCPAYCTEHIKELSIYELPEVIVTEIDYTMREFGDWVRNWCCP